MTGHFKLLDQIESEVPKELQELLNIPNLGPKRVQLLHQKLGVNSLKKLQEVAENKELLNVRGFGDKLRLSILESLKKNESRIPARLRFDEAEKMSSDLLDYLKQNKKILRTEVAGSLRRKKDSIGDIDLVASSRHSEEVMNYFLKYPEAVKVISEGPTRSTIQLSTGMQVDLRVVAPESYATALLYLTGSKAHNVALRFLAIKSGFKLNEYELLSDEKKINPNSEAEIYKALKMRYIEPELRENTGEIEAALKNQLPQLITIDDIRGDLHCHSSATDGSESIEQLAISAQKIGYSYIAITDHSKHLTIAHGLDEKQLLAQIKEIDSLNKKYKDFRIFKSCEVDILTDGSLDISDEVLSRLDFTVCAVHSQFNLSKENQTERILKAMKNRNFHILAHPTGRLINQREPYEIDLQKIIKAAADLGKILELNAQPDRMDMSEQFCRMAKDSAVKIAISTDSHNSSQLGFMRYGVNQARRGWLEKKDVINTSSLKVFEKYFNGG